MSEREIIREEIGSAAFFALFIVCCILWWVGTP